MSNGPIGTENGRPLLDKVVDDLRLIVSQLAPMARYIRRGLEDAERHDIATRLEMYAERLGYHRAALDRLKGRG